MKRSSNRALSRFLAGVMLVSSMLTNVYIPTYAADAEVSAYEVVTSGSGITTPVAGQDYTFDLTDGSIIPTDTDGKTDIDAGIFRVKVGNKNAYGYNGTQHGSVLKDGNTVEVDVAGSGTLKIEGCNYSNEGSITVTSADGSYTQTIASTGSANGGEAICGATLDFNYEGEATTLTIAFTATTYVSAIAFKAAVDEPTVELAKAEAGKSYTADFAANDPGDKSLVGGVKFADDTMAVVSPDGKAYFHGSGHGLALYNSDQIKVAVAGSAEVTFKLCEYGNGVEYAVTDADGNALGKIAAKEKPDGTEVTYSYSGEATTLTFTLKSGGEAYLHSVTSQNAAAPVGEAESFELWLDDIAYDTTSTDADGNPVVTKTIDQQSFQYKDSTLSLIGNKSGDELTKFTPSWGSGQNVERAGKIVNGYKAGNRNASCNDLPAVPTFGDGTAIVFSPAATGMFNAYIASTSFLRVWDFDATTGERYGYTDSDVAVPSYAFKAQAGHTYVLSTTGKTNNMVYCGFEYIVDEPVSIPSVAFNNINANPASVDTLQVYLTDAALGTVETTVTSKTTSIGRLANGHTYILSTNDGGVKATIAGSDRFKATGESIVIDLEDIPDQTLTGEITGTDVATVASLKFVNKINGVEFPATINPDSTYTCTLKPGDYTTVAETTNGAKTYDNAKVVQGAENVNEVYFELPDPNHFDLPTEWNNASSKLTITSETGKYNNSTSVAMYAGDTITVPVSGKQKVTVSGWYAGAWDINGQVPVETNSSMNAANPTTNTYTTDGTETSVTVNILPYVKADGTEVTGPTYLYWIQLDDVIEFKPEINVPGDYATLNEADEAICAMVRPEGEAGRVTINMTADMQEQVTFDAPYVTLNGNGHELSWYYGVGTFYYSIDKSTGLYSERLFRDKYNSNEADGSLWGGVALIKGDNFVAVDTTFKNTYNYYIVDKELEDIAYTVGGLPERVAGADVAIYKAKERSNAFYIAADNIECYNCKILSSQDTLGRNGSANNNYHTYFKDCVIGGNVDYICGEFTAIFDNCELQWKTYSDAGNNGKIGYIVAPKTSPYIFRDCTVTTDTEAPEPVLGQYGRTWGKESYAIFMNTETNGLVGTAWGEMSKGEFETAKFMEKDNTSNGTAFVTTNGAVLGDADAETMGSDAVIETYLNNWTPKYYGADDTMLGDVDMDGTITANDASAAYQFTLNKKFNGYKNYSSKAADVDGVEGISAADAAWILQKALISTTVFPAEESGEEEPTPSELAETTVYVVGDSTGCHYGEKDDPNYYYKRVGFGDKLADYLDPKATVVNLALSGRSSKSFLAEANYETLKKNIKEGDFLIIAFGHNDEKSDDVARYTAPGGTKDTEGSFKNSLYTNYVKLAQDAGATPIVCSPIVRRTDSGNWSASNLHQANGGDYAADAKALAEETGAEFIDLTYITKAKYDELTPAKSVNLHAWTNSKNTSVDNTHLNNYGAKEVAYLIATNATATLAPYVVSGITEPTEADLVVNPDYVEASDDDLTGDQLNSLLWKTTSPWYGTVFGDIGGEDKLLGKMEDGVTSDPTKAADKDGDGIPNFFVNEEADGSVRVKAGDASAEDKGVNSFGKIAGSTDGLAMYYQPVDAKMNFSISAKAHVKNLARDNGQVSFGVIVSDKVLVDENNKISVDYIAAGPLKMSASVGSTDAATGAVTTAWGGFARLAGTLTKGGEIATLDEVPKGGDVINLKITKLGNKYTVEYGNKVSTFEAEFTGTVYAGLFAARCADVTYTDIVFNNEVTEEFDMI